MTVAVYKIAGDGERWHVEVDSVAEGDWETKEAAYEAAVAAGSNAIKKGLGVRIEVPEPHGEASLG
ncbi:hypothetical protein GJW-30_1_02064 [Variibacter gotjawalensis]|uniref:DUF2188 domain-containing protein n=1 Tax=Variibacter gotjawalensis TaxID=1333996 RepID=A0A0S3PUD7_9BRAD|nr:hypothetical protein [Variibacter gotjawalensis]NIK49856.1 hypothetical protein [Variibacter gotjawalensis]RZS45855.1 hypothetical protein EV661_4181 [Variibacter gotjawalensis]BAT59531.1 hypothetical protein GJW-30_1_02064 [Variibacter gotjawalensis]